MMSEELDKELEEIIKEFSSAEPQAEEAPVPDSQPEETPELTEEKTEKHRRNWQRTVLVTTIVLLSAILALGIFALIALDYVDDLFGHFNQTFPTADPTATHGTDIWGPPVQGSSSSSSQGTVPLPTDPSGTEDPSVPPSSSVPPASTVPPTTSPEIPPIEESDKVKHIMLLGTDKEGLRTDTMMLCTININKNTITLTSFLRDIMVTVPGYDRMCKLNAVYGLKGGGQKGLDLMEEVCYNNFGIRIDDFAMIRMQDFSTMIDLMGGVKIKLSSLEVNHLKKFYDYDLKVGENLLTGNQALAYARIRYIDGDFQRTGRQQKVIEALFNAYKNKPITEMMDTMKKILPLISVTMDKDDLWTYARQVAGMITNFKIVRKQIPIPDYLQGEKWAGMYKEHWSPYFYIEVNFDLVRQYLAQILAP